MEMVTGHAVEMFLADAGSDNEGAAVEVAVGACATLVGSTDVDAGDGADAADDDGIGEETCWLLCAPPAHPGSTARSETAAIRCVCKRISISSTAGCGRK